MIDFFKYTSSHVSLETNNQPYRPVSLLTPQGHPLHILKCSAMEG